MRTDLLNWKGILCLVLSTVVMLLSCESQVNYHQPETTAQHKVIIKADACDQERFQQTQDQLTQRLVKNEIYYQSIEANVEKEEIVFNIIGYEEGVKLAPQFGELLTQQIDVRLIPALRISDHNLKSTLDTIVQKENLASIFIPNYDERNRMRYSPAVLGVCDTESKRAEIEVVLKRFEEDLPFTFIWGTQDIYADGGEQTFHALYAFNKKQKMVISESQIEKADVAPNKYTGEFEILLQFDERGAKNWSKMTTTAAYDANREILIIIDNLVKSAPSVREPILGGRSAISGNFSLAEITALTDLINIGNPPCQLNLISVEHY